MVGSPGCSFLSLDCNKRNSSGNPTSFSALGFYPCGLGTLVQGWVGEEGGVRSLERGALMSQVFTYPCVLEKWSGPEGGVATAL